MPKLKTNKAARKRFKLTAGGKILASQTKRRHLLADKEPGMKRRLRSWVVVDPRDKRNIKRLLPYG